jgi:hypothetical protein
VQVVLNDGNRCNDVKVILKKWLDDFCSLLNVAISIKDDTTFNVKNGNLDPLF